MKEIINFTWFVGFEESKLLNKETKFCLNVKICMKELNYRYPYRKQPVEYGITINYIGVILRRPNNDNNFTPTFVKVSSSHYGFFFKQKLFLVGQRVSIFLYSDGYVKCAQQ